ncbi:MAG TPA: hypothetical protein VJL32_02740 [Candidatus Paceibacterota bacterium]
MRIEGLKYRTIFNSGGKSALEVGVMVDKRWYLAEIPSGQSAGEREAKVFSIPEVQSVWKKIVLRVEGLKFKTLEEFDDLILRLDGTERKTGLGGNVLLGLSLAFARALARENRVELWQLLREEFFSGVQEIKYPVIFANLIEGGVHARNNLDIQEYLILADTKPGPLETIGQLVAFYETLGEYISARAKLRPLPIGSEGGYNLFWKNNEEPIAALAKIIKAAKLPFRIGLDAAASEFHEDDSYRFESRKRTSEHLRKIYSRYLKKYPELVSLEDPFGQNDRKGFKDFIKTSGGILVVGDDLTTTNPKEIERCAEEGLISGVIIKANQIGTLSETCRAINIAHANGLKCVVSHRGQETEDVFLADIARAGNTYGVKIGAPARERILKYNELLRLYS